VGRPGIEPGPRSLKGYRSALELTSLAFFWTGAFHRVRPFRIVSWGAWDSNPASVEATDLQSALGATPTPQIKKGHLGFPGRPRATLRFAKLPYMV
jgi:hypothetical protein